MRRAIGTIVIAAVAFTAGAWAQSTGISLDQANTWSKDNGYMTGERYQDNITREQVNAVLMRYHCDKHGQADPDCGAGDSDSTTDDPDSTTGDQAEPLVVELDWLEARGDDHLYRVRSVPPLNRFNDPTYRLVADTYSAPPLAPPLEWAPGDMLKTTQPIAHGEHGGLTCEGIHTGADQRCELRVYQNGELTVIDGKLQDGLDPAPPSGQAEPYTGVWRDISGGSWKPPPSPTPTDQHDHNCDNIPPETAELVFRLCYLGLDTLDYINESIEIYRYALLKDTPLDPAGIRQAWITSHTSSEMRLSGPRITQTIIDTGIGPHPRHLTCWTLRRAQDRLRPRQCWVEIYIEDELVWINGREIERQIR